MNQHYFDIPFAFSGDKTAIPDPLQVGGTVSFTEGWNYNYQRNLSTDPAALPIDRSTTNWLFDQITTALQALQQQGVPEFILSSQNGGTAYSYGKGAVVLWSASGNAPFSKYVSLTAGNTNTPSASDPQGLTTGWQVVVDPISTAAQAGAGTDDASIMTPLKVAQQVALRALLAGSSSQVFNVATAASATQAVPLAQAQGMQGNFAGNLHINTAGALTLAQLANNYIDYYGPAGTLTLPSAATLGIGKFCKFTNYGSGVLTLAVAGGSDFLYPGVSKTSIALQVGDDIEIIGLSATEIDVIGGSAVRQFYPLVVGSANVSTAAVQAQQIQNQSVTAYTAAGTAPVYTLTVAPAPAALAANQRWRVKFAANGTTGSNTLNLNGSGAKNLMQFASDGSLVAATVLAGMLTDVEYDGTEYIILDPITQGALLRTSVFFNNAGILQVSVNGGAFVTASSTATLLALTKTVDIECVGAGGGSGGVAATTSTTYAATSGAQSGAYSRGIFAASAINGQTITCGLAGAGGAAGNNSGTAGGASSVGSVITAPGGQPTQGTGTFATTGNFVAAPASTTQAIGTGGQILRACGSGQLSLGLLTASGNSLLVGAGADTPLGAGGIARNSGGANASGYGAGASGAGIGISTSAQAGFNGAPGAIIMREYA